MAHENVTLPDQEYFGDLGALRSFPPTSVNNVVLRRFVAGENGFEVTNELKASLEGRINDFFLSRRMELVTNFQTLPLWQNFMYMVALIKQSADNNSGSFNYNSVVGVLLAHKISTRVGPMILYQVIGIDNDYRGNGYLKDLIRAARATDRQLALKSGQQKTMYALSALKTSSLEADAKYSKHSDYRVPTEVPSNGHGDGIYVVHFFGFKDPYKKYPTKKHSLRMHEVAHQITSIPPIFRKLETYEIMHRQVQLTEKRFGHF